MSNLLEVTGANFESEVLKSDIPVLVDCAAAWCGPCKKLAPVVAEIAEEFAGKAKICHLDVDEASDIAGEYGVMSVPTLMYFKGGNKVEESVGLIPKQKIVDTLNGLL